MPMSTDRPNTRGIQPRDESNEPFVETFIGAKTMTLFRRVHDILTANVNDLVDRFEDPEKMLRQAVREMDEAIAVTTGAAARAIAAQKRLAPEIEIEHDKAAGCQRRAVAAVTAGDDGLARQAVMRRREHEQLAAALEEQRTDAEAS